MAMKDPAGTSKKAAGDTMKKPARTAESDTDGAYRVSAAAVADKLLERMCQGMDPRLFSQSVLARLCLDPGFHSRAEVD
jgi:hypothetical protein